jgi:hypothetical protein
LLFSSQEKKLSKKHASGKQEDNMHRLLKTLITGLLIVFGANVTVSAQGLQWEPVEIEFTASHDHAWHDFPLQVIFSHSDSDTQITLDAYWDGGRSWKVRFAPSRGGTWTWISRSADAGLDNQSGSIDCEAPSAANIADNPNLRGHLTVGPDGRRLAYDDGEPFFWLGDTNWAISSDRCGVDNGNFYTYADDRKQKRFNVIQIQFFSRKYYNEGGYPFPANHGENPGNGRFGSLNPAYFQQVDTRIDYLFQQGFVVAGHPTWLSETRIDQTWAQRIFRYLLARYGAYNTVWSLTGEYQFSRNNTYSLRCPRGWEQLGDNVRTHNPYDHPITIHPTYGGPSYRNKRTFADYSSSGEFHDSEWLAINWIQTYSFVEDVSESIFKDYQKMPHKPVIMAEPGYEYFRPGNWDRQDYREIDGNLARLQAWSAILCGAAGHTYGAWGVWQFYEPNHPQPGSDGKNTGHWADRMDGEGARDMQHLRNFFTSDELDWTRLAPRRDCLLVNASAPAWPSRRDFTPLHCAAEIGRSYVVYIPSGNSGKTITVTHLAQNNYRARWFNPRNGEYIEIDNRPEGVNQWTLPSLPDGQDWVLLLSSAQPVPDEDHRYTVLRTTTPVTVDGDTSEFGNAGEIVLQNRRGTIGTCRLVWDETALYLAARVDDSALNADALDRDGILWLDDSVELLFDTDHDAGARMNDDDYKFFVSILGTQLDINGHNLDWDIGFFSQVELDGQPNDGAPDTGYVIEMAIPWSAWGIRPPAEDQVFGFDLNLNDQDDAGERDHACWSNSDQGTINNPDGWGEMVFSGQSVRIDSESDR